ncbi:hypothetical protein [Amorphus sp. MBR-141]
MVGFMKWVQNVLTWSLLVFAAAGLCGSAGILGFWIADREPPVRFYSGAPGRAIIGGGATLEIAYDVRVERLCASTMVSVLTDSSGARFPLQQLSTPPPSHPSDATVIYKVLVPRRMAKGPAEHHGIAEFVCNPIHRIWPLTVKLPEIDFAVR